MNKLLSKNMLKGQNLVIVSGEFGRYPSSMEHLVRQLLPTNRVLWIEITGMRTPKFNIYDLKRATGKVKRLFKGAASVEQAARGMPPNIHLSSPVTVPFPAWSVVRSLNNTILVHKIKKETANLGFEDFGLITTLPMAADAVADSGAAWSLYYCPDEWSLWPGLNKKLIETWETTLLSVVDGIVVTSENLKKSKSQPTKQAEIVNHGVDVTHFSRANKRSGMKTATFFGLFDQRIDQNLLAFLARKLPDFTFEMIGPVQCSINEELLTQNFIWTGPVPYSELPLRLCNASVLLLPYLKNELTENINPLKARECLATGKPVVATSISEVKNMDHIFVANDYEEFLCQVKIATAASDYNGAAVIDSMTKFSWENQASELSRILQDIISEKVL